MKNREPGHLKRREKTDLEIALEKEKASRRIRSMVYLHEMKKKKR